MFHTSYASPPASVEASDVYATRERLPSVRLMFDGRQGLQTTSGYLADIDQDGCELRLNSAVAPGMAGRLQVDLGGSKLWLPVITTVNRADGGRRAVSVDFDRLPADKKTALHRLLAQRSV